MSDPTTGHPRRWTALAVLCLSLVITTLDNTVLNTALPSLARALRATTADLQWITDSYTLVFAALLVIAGGLGARLGPRRAIVGGLSLFAAGSVGAALSTSSAQLIGFRAVMGVGAAFVMPSTLAIISMIFPLRERPKAVAIWSATAGVGVVLGPVLGGALLERFAWGSVFWINVPLIAVAVTGMLALVPSLPGRRTGRLDLLGALLSTAGLAALVDMIIEAPRRGWLAGTTLVEAAAAVVLLAGFVGWELRTAHPMINVRVFGRRTFSVAGLALAVTFFGLFGALFVYSQYLQVVHGFSPIEAGLGAMPFAVAMAATSGTSNLITARLGTRASVAVGLAVVGLALGALSLTTVHTAFATLAGIMAVMGGGMGMIMAPASLSTLSSVPQDQAATASAMNSVLRELGGVLGIAVVGSVVAAGYRSHLTAGVPVPATHDITAAHRVAAELPGPVAARLIDTANHAFVTAMDGGFRIAGLVALAGAVAAALWLPTRAGHPAPAPATEPAATEPAATEPAGAGTAARDLVNA